MARDPWDVLGVAKTATNDEIKRAFKRQAMMTHPDKQGGSEERFKEVNEAYSHIKDEQSRAKYQNSQMGGFNFGDMKADFDFQGSPFGGMHVDLNEFFGKAFGQGFQGAQQQHFPENRDLNVRYSVTLEESHVGVRKQIKVKGPDGNPKIVDLMIPKGVDNGHKIRYTGLGENRYTNVKPGDLYVNISLKNHSKYEKFENNLVTKCTIDSIDAILGCTRIVESIDGDKVSLNIQPGTQHDLRLRIPERGTYEIDNPKRGDLLVKININTPQKIHTKDELIELIRKKTTK